MNNLIHDLSIEATKAFEVGYLAGATMTQEKFQNLFNSYMDDQLTPQVVQTIEIMLRGDI